MTAYEAIEAVAASAIVTRANFEALLDSGQIEVAMNNGRWWRIRRHGATKTWKKDPSRVRVPFKAGLRVFGVIDQDDFIGGCLNPRMFRRHIG